MIRGWIACAGSCISFQEMLEYPGYFRRVFTEKKRLDVIIYIPLVGPNGSGATH